jgi:hypothetical protein
MKVTTKQYKLQVISEKSPIIPPFPSSSGQKCGQYSRFSQEKSCQIKSDSQ